ncbi:protransforming growth factor alpha isoform X2 [Thalassophryne amazonica]|uniref:protransforming growth factor alpha isoform X2 n=1 Tax=Thalassophryne amazonica TaxID=390379 RepID=UPI0014721B48|nr:protransforming growth factor alpha isoform X2 [Thalassophryne amazonica]
MTRIFWDVIFLISGTFSMSVVLDGAFFTFGAGYGNSTVTDASNAIDANSTGAPDTSVSSSATTTTTTTTTNSIAATTVTATNTPHVKKFVAALHQPHFHDCPDSHRHFCFHGTCRFLILEETPACVCHPGFVGMRCEHADLLAIVATNHRQRTTSTVLVLCAIGCVLVMVLCTFVHFWWRRDCRRRRHTSHHCVVEKSSSTPRHRTPCLPESVV